MEDMEKEQRKSSMSSTGKNQGKAFKEITSFLKKACLVGKVCSLNRWGAPPPVHSLLGIKN